MRTLQSLALAVVLAFAVAAHADTSDFALFDGTNPDNLPDAGAVCSAKSAFTYHVAVANWGPAGEVWISYSDGDLIRFPILTGGSFAFSQAAGSKGRADRAVRVWNGGTAAQLAGSMSAVGQGNPECLSCDATADGDQECDKLVKTNGS